MLQASQDRNLEIIDKCRIKLTLNPMVIEDENQNLMKELTKLNFKIIYFEPFVVEIDINPTDFQAAINKLIEIASKYTRKEVSKLYEVSDVEKQSGSCNEQDNDPTDVKIKKDVSQKDLQQQAVQIKSRDLINREKSVDQLISSTESKTGSQSSSAATHKPDKHHDQETKGNPTCEISAKIKENRPKPKAPSTSSQDSDDSEPEAYCMSIKQDLFHAAKYYFKNSEFLQFFKFSVKNGSNVEFSIPSSYIEGENFISKLKEFKMYEFDAKDKQKTIISYVEENYSRTIAVSHGYSLLTLMGLGDEFQHAKKQILAIMENNDGEEFLSTSKTGEKSLSDSSTAKTLDGNDNGMKVTTNDVISENGEKVYKGSSGMEIKVHSANITKLDVDCIVNAANRRLKHGGGVAKVIANAAGEKLLKECNDYIDAYEKVDVSDIFVSSGGYLPAKYVMHAVGPKWEEYTDKSKCINDLRRTVVRCLAEASKLKVSTIAFPSISAAIFKVPQDICAESYMNAVKNFDLIAKQLKLSSPHQVFFVDINKEMIHIIAGCFDECWMLQPNMRTFEEDLLFVKGQLAREPRILKPQQGFKAIGKNSEKNMHIASGGYSQDSNPQKGSHLRAEAEEFHPGVKEKVYKVGTVKLCVTNKPAFDVGSNLIITIGEPFDKLSGFPGFKTSNLKRIERIENAEFLEFEAKDKTSHYICKIVVSNPDISKLPTAFDNFKAMIASKREHFKAIVITSKFLYPGQSRDNKVPPEKQVGKFAELVYKFVEKDAVDEHFPRTVTVTAGEAESLKIIQVFNSRQQGNPNKKNHKSTVGCSMFVKSGTHGSKN